jgi:nucleotidyltransferase substrate binding protein (TIGR01987 family)
MAQISLDEFTKALAALKEAMSFAARSEGGIFEIARDASIQRFEFCIELSWKVAAKKLGSASTAAKPVLREMAQNGLIGDVTAWFAYIEARNKSSHSYDKKIAGEVFSVIPGFLVEAQKLLVKLEEL